MACWGREGSESIDSRSGESSESDSITRRFFSTGGFSTTLAVVSIRVACLLEQPHHP